MDEYEVEDSCYPIDPINRSIQEMPDPTYWHQDEEDYE